MYLNRRINSFTVISVRVPSMISLLFFKIVTLKVIWREACDYMAHRILILSWHFVLDYYFTSFLTGIKKMQVLTNGIEVKLQRNALSVIEAPTGNEEDDDLEFENMQWNGSDMGEYCTVFNCYLLTGTGIMN